MSPPKEPQAALARASYDRFGREVEMHGHTLPRSPDDARPPSRAGDFSGAEVEQDTVGIWGRRIGRALGWGAAALLVLHLLWTCGP